MCVLRSKRYTGCKPVSSLCMKRSSEYTIEPITTYYHDRSWAVVIVIIMVFVRGVKIWWTAQSVISYKHGVYFRGPTSCQTYVKIHILSADIKVKPGHALSYLNNCIRTHVWGEYVYACRVSYTLQPPTFSCKGNRLEQFTWTSYVPWR